MAVPIYIPCNKVQGFPSLHILISICNLWSFRWRPFLQVCGDISFWFSFASPWWLVLLSIFFISQACWSPAFPLWKQCQFFYFLIRFFFFFLMLSFTSCLYMLDINTWLVMAFANIFSHSVCCLFVLLMVSFAVQKLLNLIKSHLIIFWFYFHYSRRWIQK